ncbi:MAG: hypothetical protein ACRDZM_13675, partial [Acidimicrobiia bacterium]
MKQLSRLLALLAVLALVIAACGGGDEEGGATTTGGSDGTAEGGGDAADAEFTLFGSPTGVEGDALTGFLDVYNEATGS